MFEDILETKIKTTPGQCLLAGMNLKQYNSDRNVKIFLL